MILLKEFFEKKMILKKISRRQKKHEKFLREQKGNLFLDSGGFCRLLITFANSLEPDPVRFFLIKSTDDKKLSIS